MVNGRTEPWRTSIALRGGSAANGDARRIVVGADDINAENSFAEPLKISAQESNMKVSGNTIDVECPARLRHDSPYPIEITRVNLQ